MLINAHNALEITTVFDGAHLSPFIRARVPELEQQYGLSSRVMLAFVDGLNEAFMANPTFQVTNHIGDILGFVPLQTTQIVGASINLAAGLGAAGVSIVRTKQYMKKANERIFKPKGLHAQICKTGKMLGQVGMANDTVIFAKTQYQAPVSSARANEPSGNAITRRMEPLGDRVMALSFDNISAPVSPDNWMKKVGVYAVQRAEKKQLEKLEKHQAEAEKKSVKAEREIAKAELKRSGADDEMEEITEDMNDVESQMQCLDPNHPRYGRRLRELRREYRELDRKLKEVDLHSKSRKADKVDKMTRKRGEKTKEREIKEVKKVKKMYWILITTQEESPVGEDDWASDDSSDSAEKSVKV
ncbi:uncharacterized protein N7482_007499 [Penicillium canariense]|uniref:Uncharacterized protein n=1 Tax=Penicillium canariense TaxID=189055 RepID=A0A9W9I1T6_9EURO|nr:uncharacterized protein N7482_007499 [Penicillium canariense]KAJ5160495.1 hypothetical protein N7482_007499 [Penicillium canariense]